MTNKKIFILIIAIASFLLVGQVAAALTNPLGDNDMNVGDLFLRIVRAFIGLIGVVATVYFIFSGFMMMTSGGNPEKVNQAKSGITYAILGMVITFSSWQIMMFVIEMLEGSV